MNRTIKAVIFDMDGVLVDSEPLWRRAMIEGFGQTGIAFTEDDCRKTTGIRFKEVVEYWLEHHKAVHISAKDLENTIMQLLLQLIENEGKAIGGILEVIDFCKTKKLKIGLATSSSNLLMTAVLKKLSLDTSFDFSVSAEHMTYGKPHPEVFLACAKNLNVAPYQCLVIEDSVNGIIAAKAAFMKVVAVPDKEHFESEKFAIADHKLADMTMVLALFKTLFI